VSRRGARSWLVSALVALAAAPAFLATLAPAGATAATTGPALSLLDQSPYVMPALPGGPARFHIEVGVGSGVPSDAELTVTVYSHLTSRSAFEATLSNPPSDELQSLSATAVSSLSVGANGGRQLNLAVVPQSSSTAGVESPTIDLDCNSLTNGCSGVYPIVVALERPEAGVLAHFTTYLTYTQGNEDPLYFSWIVPFNAPVHLNPKSGPLSDAVLPPSATDEIDLEQLAALLKGTPQVPVTIEASPQTLQQLDVTPPGRQAVSTLVALSADQSTHQFLPQPYVPIDLNSLSAAGVTEEIVAQMRGGAGAEPLGLKTDPPLGENGSTWVATGGVGTALARGLQLVGANRVVVPDADLTMGTDVGHRTWSQPFELDLSKGQTVVAAASDGELSADFAADPSDPVLAANQLLADLSVIHLVEAPFPPDPRGVIAVPPQNWVPVPSFVSTLLKGLSGNPVVQATTLDGFFTHVPKGGNDSSVTRHLQASGAGPSLTSVQAAAVVRARNRASAFVEAVPRQAPVRAEMANLLLASEFDGFRGDRATNALSDFERQLAGQLSLVQVASRTITITAQNASIPITLTSAAPYSVRGRLLLASGKLEFPRGATRAVTINHQTNSTRVDVRARTSGDLPLQLTLTTPNGALVIASGTVTVRSTATSVVGIVLTALAVLVLGVWWARTWRRSRLEKRGRPTRGSATHALQ
jgi:hypothetical protein